MTDHTPRAAIVIPHYNDTARLALCLDALAPQVADGRAEVVVVDNGSDADLGPLQARFGWARFLSEPEKGAAPARNHGVAASTAPFLFFIDADCIPAPDWVATALGLCAAGGPDWHGLIGGRIDVFDEPPPPRSGAEAFETVFAFRQETYVTRKHFSVTANLLTTRRVFDDVGPFDGRVVEDWDWCDRAWRKGYPIRYEDGLVVRHPTRSDWSALRRKWRRTMGENFRFNGTSPARRLVWGVRAFAVMGSGIWHLRDVLRHPALAPVEKWRGAGTLLRLRFLRMVWMLGQALRGA